MRQRQILAGAVREIEMDLRIPLYLSDTSPLTRGSSLRRVITADREGCLHIGIAILVSWYRLRFRILRFDCVFRFLFVLMEDRRCLLDGFKASLTTTCCRRVGDRLRWKELDTLHPIPLLPYQLCKNRVEKFCAAFIPLPPRSRLVLWRCRLCRCLQSGSRGCRRAGRRAGAFRR